MNQESPGRKTPPRKELSEESLHTAGHFKQFLEWASEQTGRQGFFLREEGYFFHRSVSVYGSHSYETPSEEEVDELILRFLEENP